MPATTKKQASQGKNKQKKRMSISQKHAYVFIFAYRLPNGQSLTAHTLRRAKRPQRSRRPLKFCGQLHQKSHRLHRRGSFVCRRLSATKQVTRALRSGIRRRNIQSEQHRFPDRGTLSVAIIKRAFLFAVDGKRAALCGKQEGCRRVCRHRCAVSPRATFQNGKTSILPCGDS